MAIDPATAKALVTAATKVVTDSETRKKVLIIILAPTIGLLLLIAMILQILTMPFAMLVEAFSGDELAHVQNMRADTAYTQLISKDDESYKESYGQTYEGIILSSGSTQVVYYNQLDSRWQRSYMYIQHYRRGRLRPHRSCNDCIHPDGYIS
jgi:hypothetical protein